MKVLKWTTMLSALIACSFFAWQNFFEIKPSYVPVAERGLPLYYWEARIHHDFSNFGDGLSEKIVEKMVGHPLLTTFSSSLLTDLNKKKLLAIGSIMHMAQEGDVIWGSGFNGKHLDLQDKQFYRFKNLDVRAVRGPLSRQLLLQMGIACPEIYGDPALLLPKLYPDLKKQKSPSTSYIIIPHCDHEHFFKEDPHLISAKEDVEEIIRKILDTKLVIATSMHALIVAEAFGVPARYLKISDSEPLFKYADYYHGTGRPNFSYATSLEEALKMGGESPLKCDLDLLMKSFPYDQFPRSRNFALLF